MATGGWATISKNLGFLESGYPRSESLFQRTEMLSESWFVNGRLRLWVFRIFRARLWFIM